MGYIASNQIAVFPCGRRDDAIDPAARLTTEFNLVSIINRLVDQKSFVVTPINAVSNSNTIVEFNIGGYLFKTTISQLNTASNIGNNSGYIYGQIQLNQWASSSDSTTNYGYQDLSSFESDVNNLDSDNGFTGLRVSNNNEYEQTSDTELTILYKDTTTSPATYSVPQDSLIKFKTDTTSRSVFIDDGDLD